MASSRYLPFGFGGAWVSTDAAKVLICFGVACPVFRAWDAIDATFFEVCSLRAMRYSCSRESADVGTLNRSDVRRMRHIAGA